MERATRQVLELRRDTLIAEVRNLDRERNERIRELTSSSTQDPSIHTLDARVAELSSKQNQLIRRIEDIAAQIGGD
jgi:hypothetical protein